MLRSLRPRILRLLRIERKNQVKAMKAKNIEVTEAKDI